MDTIIVMKALGDENRMKILRLLLSHNYCVRALAKNLNISEAAVSQHLKTLREAGLNVGSTQSYFVHYSVNRDVLHALAMDIEALTQIERETPAAFPSGQEQSSHCCHKGEPGHICKCKKQEDTRL